MNYIFSLSWPLLWLKNIQNCLGKFLWLVDEGSFLRMKGYNKISVFLCPFLLYLACMHTEVWTVHRTSTQEFIDIVFKQFVDQYTLKVFE